MRRVILLAVLGVVPVAALAGPISDEFRSGYGGVAWGTTLVDLVAQVPGGQHLFATAAGERDYELLNDEPFLGVPRPGTAVQFGLGATNKVEIIAVNFPYERRDQLLGALISSFGSYSKRFVKGTSTYFDWPKDNGIHLFVRASTNPSYGILQLLIANAPPQVISKASQ